MSLTVVVRKRLTLLVTIAVATASLAVPINPVAAQTHPPPPSNLQIEAFDKELSVSWDHDTLTDFDAQYRVVDIDASRSGNQSGEWVYLSGRFSPDSISSLINGISYEVRVRGFNTGDDETKSYTDWTSTVSGTPQLGEFSLVPTDAALTGLSLATSTDGLNFNNLPDSIHPTSSFTTADKFYAVVASDVTHVELTPSAASGVSISGTRDGNEIASMENGVASEAISLKHGDTTIAFETTSADGNEFHSDYSLTIQREPPTPSITAIPTVNDGKPAVELTHDKPTEGFKAALKLRPKDQSQVADLTDWDSQPLEEGLGELVLGEDCFSEWVGGIEGKREVARTRVAGGLCRATEYEARTILVAKGIELEVYKTWWGKPIASETVAFTTFGLPGKPSEVRASAVDSSQVKVRWDAATDHGGVGAEALKYRLRLRPSDEPGGWRSLSGGGNFITVSGECAEAGKCHTIGGLKSSTEYVVEVLAYNGIGQDEDFDDQWIAARQTATTGVLATPTQSDFTITPGDQALEVSWPSHSEEFGTDFEARWRVRDTGSGQPGDWAPSEFGEFFVLEISDEGHSITIPTVCSGCDALVNGTTYEVEFRFLGNDETNDKNIDEWAAAGDGTPAVPVPTELSISVASKAVGEDVDTVTVTATLDNPTNAATAVTFTATDIEAEAGSDKDFTVPATFTATIAQNETEGTAEVTINDDDIDEDDETFSLAASAEVTSPSGSTTTLTADALTVTINDDDEAGINVSPTALTLALEESTSYDVVLESEPTADVTVRATSSSATDATVSPSSRTFTPGNWDTPQTFAVTGKTAGSSPTITHAMTSSDSKYSALSPDDVSVNVEASDPSEITLRLTNAPITEGNGSGHANVRAELNQPTKEDVIVFLSLTDGTAKEGEDYQNPGAQDSIEKGSTSVATDIVILGDDISEPDETFTVTASVDIAGTTITSDPLEITIKDDDSAGINVNKSTLDFRAGRNRKYKVSLSAEPTANVEITATSSNSLVTVSPSSQTLNSQNWQTGKEFVVSGSEPATAVISHSVTTTDSQFSSASVSSVDVTVRADRTLTSLTGVASTDNSNFPIDLALEPTFASDTRAYSVAISNAITHVKFTPTASSTQATVKVGRIGTTLATTTSGEASGSIRLNSGTTAIHVQVSVGQSDTNPLTYTVTLNRRGAPAANAIWLEPLQGADGEIVAVWDKGSNVGASELRWRVADADASVAGDQPGDWVDFSFPGQTAGTVTSATLDKLFDGGSLIDGVAFEVAVRGALASGHTDWHTREVTPMPSAEVAAAVALSGLTVHTNEGGSSFPTSLGLNPLFDKDLPVYYAIVPEAVTRVRIGATAETSGATVEVGLSGGTLASLTGNPPSKDITLKGPIGLASNANANRKTRIVVKVTSADSSSTATYTVVVQRMPEAPDFSVEQGQQSGDGQFLVGLRFGTPPTYIDADSALQRLQKSYGVFLKLKSTEEDWDLSNAHQVPAGTEEFGMSGGVVTGGVEFWVGEPGADYEARIDLWYFSGGVRQIKTWAGRPSSTVISFTHWELPSAPTNLTARPPTPATYVNLSQLEVSWEAPASIGGDDGAVIAKYELRYRPQAQGDRGTWTEKTLGKTSGSPAALADTLTGLTPSTTYQLQVRASNGIRTAQEEGDELYGPWSQVVTATTSAEQAPQELKLVIKSGPNIKGSFKEGARDTTNEIRLTVKSDWPARSGGLRVRFSDRGSTATSTGAQKDFALPQAVTIPQGQRSASATLTIVGDGRIEPDEKIVLFARAAGTSNSNNITITIENDDIAGLNRLTPGFTNSMSANLNVAQTITYGFSLKSEPTHAVTVTAASNKADVAAVTASRTFDSTNWFTPQSFTITAKKAGDARITNRIVTEDAVYKSGFASGTIQPLILSVAVADTGSLTLSLAIPSQARLGDTTVRETSHNNGRIGVIATLDKPARSATTVTFTASEGTAKAGTGKDYTVPDPFTAVIAVGSMAATATVTIVNDDLTESDETFNIGATAGSLTAATLTVTIAANDAPRVLFSPSVPITVAGGRNKTYTVKLNSEPTHAVTISTGTIDDGGRGGTLTVSPASRIFNTNKTGTGGWSVPQSFTIMGGLEGTLSIAHESVSDDTNYDALSGISDVEVEVVRDNTSLAVNLQSGITNNTVNEDVGNVEFTAVLGEANANNLPTVVAIKAEGIGSKKGRDFTLPSSDTITIAAGQTSHVFTFSITDDDLDEETEKFRVWAEGAGISTKPSAVTLTITDDDTAGVEVSKTNLEVEIGSEETYTVKLTSQPREPVTVTAMSRNLAAAGIKAGSSQLEFGESGQVEFRVDDWGTAKTFTVKGKAKGIANIRHRTASDDPDYSTSLSVASITATVSHPRPTALTITGPASGNQLAEGVGSVSVTVAINQPAPRGGLAVLLVADPTSTASSNDYTLPAEFTIAEDAMSATASVAITGDSVAEDNETIVLGVREISGVSVTGVTLTIADDDSAGVTIVGSVSSIALLVEKTKEYSVRLNSAPSAAVTITATSGATATATVSDALTFTADDYQTAKAFTVTGVKAGKTSITHTASSASDTNYGSSLAIDAVAVSVTNKPTALTLTTDAASNTIVEGEGQVEVTATLNNPAGSGGVEVALSAHSDSTAVVREDYAALPGAQTIAEGETSVAFRVRIKGDDIDDGDKKLVFTSSVAGLTITNATLTITDDDSAGLTVSKSEFNLEKGATGEYTVRLTSEPTADVTITATSGAAATATVSDALTFTSGDWNDDQVFTIRALEIGNTTISHSLASDDPNYSDSGREQGLMGDASVSVVGRRATELTLTTSATNDTVAEGSATTSVTITATLNQPAKAPGVSGRLVVRGSGTTAIDEKNYGGLPVSFTIAAGLTVGTATIEIRANDIDQDDVNLEVGATVGEAGRNPQKFTVSPVTLTITDDSDAAGLVIVTSERSIANGAILRLRVKLNSEPTSQVTLTPSSSNAQILSVAEGSPVFNNVNWGRGQLLPLTAKGVGTAALSFSITSSDAKYEALTISPVNFTVKAEPSTITLTTNATGAKVAEGSQFEVTATLDEPISNDLRPTKVSLSVASDSVAKAEDVSIGGSGGISINDGDKKGKVRVTITDDAIAEAEERLILTASIADKSLTVVPVTLTITDNDSAGFTVSKTTLEVDAGSSGNYNLKLASQPTAPVTVTVAIVASATASVSPATFTIAPASWSVGQAVMVTGKIAGRTSISHSTTSGDPNYNSKTPAAVGVVVRSPAATSLEVSVSSVTVGESVGSVRVTATLDNPAREATLVTFTIASGTAGSGDYSAPSPATATIAVGETSATTSVAITNDDFDEDDEAFTITATAGSLTDDATITITDNDTAGVSVSKESLLIDKGSTGKYTIKLGSRPTGAVTITVVSAAAGTASVSPATLTIAAGSWETASSVVVSGVGVGSTSVTHVSSSSDSDYNAATISSVGVRVREPAPTALTVSVDAATIGEADGPVTATATLDNPARVATTVTFSVAAGTAGASDFGSPSPVSATILVGSTSVTTSVAITDDDFDEGNEAFTITATAGSLTDKASVTITDDDTAGVSVSKTAVTLDEGASDGYTITLESRPTHAVTITVTSQNTSTATVQPTTITIASDSNWGSAQSVNVSGGVAGTTNVTHTVASSDADYGGATVAGVAITVRKPPPSKLSVELSGTTVNEGVGSVTATARLDNPARAATTITFTASGGTAVSGTDYAAPSPASATIAAGSATVTTSIAITDDSLSEGSETFTVTASVVGGTFSDTETVTIADNDTAGVTFTPLALTVETSGAFNTKTYSVVLTRQPSEDVTISASSGDTDVASISPSQLVFTSSDWDSAQTIEVTGEGEGTETISHSATGQASYASLTLSGVEVTVRTPTTLEVSLGSGATSVAEGAGTAAATATLSRALATAVTVTFSTTDGTASAGDDFTVPSPFTAVIAAGSLTASVNIVIENDGLDEDDETFTLGASAASGSGLTASGVLVTITDDDTAGVSVSKATLAIDEGSTEKYTLKLDSQPTHAVTITVASAAATFASVSPATVTIAAADWETAEDVVVSGVKVGSTSITHTSASSDSVYNAASIGTVGVSVRKPAPTRLEVSLSETSVGEADGSVTVTATLDNPARMATSVTFSVSAGTAGASDYGLPSPVSVAIAVGSLSVTSSVAIVDDDFDEDNETFTVAAAAGLLSDDATVTIEDDDTHGIAVSQTTHTIDEGASAQYELKLGSRPTAAVTITIASAATATATASPAKATIAAADWGGAQTIEISGAGVGSTSITHTTSSDDEDYDEATVDAVSVKVIKPAPTSLSVTLSESAIGEASGTLTITARLNNPARTATTVSFTTTAGTAGSSDFSAPNPASVTIAVGSLSVTSTIAITNDSLAEGSETFTVAAAAGTFTDDAEVTIADDDSPGVTINPSALAVEAGGVFAEAIYTAVLTRQPAAGVTITAASSDISLATVSPAQLEFSTTDWNEAKTFTVTGVGAGSPTITHSASGQAAYAALTLSDVDVTVATATTLAVSLASGATSVSEDAGSAVATATLNRGIETAVVVTFGVVNGTARAGTEFTIPSPFTAAIAAGGTVGAVSFTIANNNVAQGNQTFTLTGTVPNTFTTSATITIVDDDAVGLTFAPTSVSVEEGGTATYTVRLNSRPSIVVAVRPTSADDDIATVETGTSADALNFRPDNFATPQAFTVTGVKIGSTSITHSAFSQDESYKGVSGAVAVGVGEPGPTTLAVSLANTSVAEAAGSVAVSATFDNAVKVATTVTFTTTDGPSPGGAVAGTDFSVPSSFTAVVAVGATAATASLTITSDMIDEGDETFSVGASGGGLTATGLVVTIVDDDTAGVAVSAATASVDKGSTTEYSLMLSSEPTSAVTIAVASDDLAVASVSAAALTFSTTDYGTAQIVTITGVEAGSANVTHSVSSSDGVYDGLAGVGSVAVAVALPAPATLGVSVGSAGGGGSGGVSLDEGAGTIAVTATFDNPVKVATTVTFSATDGPSTGGATGGSDFTIPSTFTTALDIGESVASASLTITDDKVDEGDETFVIAASGGGLTAAGVTVTITDNDTAGLVASATSVTVEMPFASVAEKDTTEAYTLKLNSEPTSDVTVAVASGAVATATVAPATLTFTAANFGDGQTITVTGVGVGETSVTHTATSSDANYEGASGSVGVTVPEPPPSSLSLSLDRTGAAEDIGSVIATLRLDKPARVEMTVSFDLMNVTSHDNDYFAPAQGSIVFAVGATLVTAPIGIVDDELDEDDERFTVTASAGALTSSAATLTIVDDDEVGVNLSNSSVSVDRGEIERLTFTLNSRPYHDVTISVASADTDTATVSPAAITLTNSNYGVAQAVTISGLVVGSTSLTYSVASKDTGYEGLAVAATSVEVEEPPPLAVRLAFDRVAESVGRVTLTAKLAEPAAEAISISFSVLSAGGFGSTTEGEDYTLPPSLIAVIGVGAISGAIQVVIKDDRIDEDDEVFFVSADQVELDENSEFVVSIDEATGNEKLTAEQIAVTIEDNDTAGVLLSRSEVSVGVSRTSSYTAKLLTEPVGAVTIAVASGDVAIATVSPASLTFDATNWDRPQAFSVSGVVVGETDLTHSVTSGDARYGATGAVVVDGVAVTVTVAPPQRNVGGPGGGFFPPPLDQDVGDGDGEDGDGDSEDDGEDDEGEDGEDGEGEDGEDTDDGEDGDGGDGDGDNGGGDGSLSGGQPSTRPTPILPRVNECEADAEISDGSFGDVDSSSFAYNDVGCLVELKVTTGTSETTYSPKQEVTREQMAAFLARLYKSVTGSDAPVVATPFVDVPASSFAADDIARIYGLGITSGTSPTTYSYDQTVTREQMASFLSRFYRAVTGSDAPVVATPFVDVPATSFAADDIARIYGLGITTGTGANTYSPKDPVTREQMAAFISRLYRILTESPSDSSTP